jgi:hypothetical protein
LSGVIQICLGINHNFGLATFLKAGKFVFYYICGLFFYLH